MIACLSFSITKKNYLIFSICPFSGETVNLTTFEMSDAYEPNNDMDNDTYNNFLSGNSTKLNFGFFCNFFFSFLFCVLSYSYFKIWFFCFYVNLMEKNKLFFFSLSDIAHTLQSIDTTSTERILEEAEILLAEFRNGESDRSKKIGFCKIFD